MSIARIGSVYQKKICLIGDSGTGKTSLIRKYTTGLFDEKYIATIGTNITTKTVTMNILKKKVDVSLIIWDILGQHGYPRVLSRALKGVHGILLVCDITKKETLESINRHWLPEIKKGLEKVPMLILANKSDIKEKAIMQSELRNISIEHELPFLRTSAKTGENVETGFNTLSEMLIAAGVEAYDFAESPYLSREIKTLQDVADSLMYEFYTQLGDNDIARHVVRTKFSEAKIDLGVPTVEALKKAIEIFYALDIQIGGETFARERKNRREQLLEEHRKR